MRNWQADLTNYLYDMVQITPINAPERKEGKKKERKKEL